jgi:hypothetical protein
MIDLEGSEDWSRKALGLLKCRVRDENSGKEVRRLE